MKAAMALLVVALALLAPAPASSQVLRGAVVEEGTSRPVPRALVRLLDADGEDIDFVQADSLGQYLLPVGAQGEYRLAVDAFGYEPLESQILEVGERPAYVVNLWMLPAPIGLSGLEVSAERYAELEDGLRLEIGVHPRSLRNEPILRSTIEDHLARSHDLEALIRWSELPSIVTRTTTDGPCFQWRARHCMPVYLNGSYVRPQAVGLLPLDVAEMIVVITPGESAAYAGGAVLLYTAGWVR